MSYFFFLMTRRATRSTRTDTLFPITTLCRSTISGLDELRSSTIEGQSQVFATFVLERNVQEAANDVREKVGAVLSRFPARSEEHTSELQSLMRISYAVFCLKNKQVTHRQSNININK